MPTYGRYLSSVTRLQTFLHGAELVVTFPYDAPTQEIAWLLDSLGSLWKDPSGTGYSQGFYGQDVFGA